MSGKIYSIIVTYDEIRVLRHMILDYFPQDETGPWEALHEKVDKLRDEMDKDVRRSFIRSVDDKKDDD